MTNHDPITTVNLSLPASLLRFVEAEVAKRGCASLSEYFRELIRERQLGSCGDESIRNLESARAAVRLILELQKTHSLGGDSIEDLIGEGRDS